MMIATLLCPSPRAGKAEWEDPADVALIDAMTFGEIKDRPNFAAPDPSEPMSALRDRGDQMRVGSRRSFPGRR